MAGREAKSTSSKNKSSRGPKTQVEAGAREKDPVTEFRAVKHKETE